MFEIERIKLPTWTKCAIILLLYHMYNANAGFLLPLLFPFSLFFFFLFLKTTALKQTWRHRQHHTSPGIPAFFFFFSPCCEIILKTDLSLLLVVQLWVLAVRAAAGGHLSKYITVIWIKTTDVWNKMSYWWTSCVSRPRSFPASPGGSNFVLQFCCFLSMLRTHVQLVT